VVRRPHGVRGEVLIEPLSDVPGRLALGSQLQLVTTDERRSVRVETSRPHARGLILRLSGCADRDAAEALRGATLAVERGASPAPPTGSYYHHELVGCVCHDATHGDLGVVTELIADGGGLILKVEKQARTLLVPFAAAYLRFIDPATRRIEMTLPAGLLETCASPS
jgi:16S rRNA processing protein RimM